MIDWTRVADLRAEVGEESFAEIVELFLEEVTEAASRLSADAPPGSLADELHFLKGSALNLGFMRLGEICAAGERDAAAGRRVDVAAIRACLAESRRQFLGRLAEGTSR